MAPRFVETADLSTTQLNAWSSLDLTKNITLGLMNGGFGGFGGVWTRPNASLPMTPSATTAALVLLFVVVVTTHEAAVYILVRRMLEKYGHAD